MLNANILFYIFSILIIISAFMVIVSNHPVFSLLFLVGCFLFSAFLLFLLECEFLALLFIVIYVGAIAILFLFAVMMLESKLVNLSTNRMKYIPVGFSFGLMLLIPLLSNMADPFNTTVYYNTFYLHKYQNWYDLIDSVTDIEVYGEVFLMIPPLTPAEKFGRICGYVVLAILLLTWIDEFSR